MFRIENNVPSVYINESRDFQLFCRLYTCIISGVRFDVQTMINLFDPFLVNDRMLELLCTRVGFFHKKDYDSKSLRYITSAFPYLVKYKGSKWGISAAISLVFKILNINSQFVVQIDNNNHIIHIYSDEYFYFENLNELLEYVIPIGYTYDVIYIERESGSSNLGLKSEFSSITNLITDVSQVSPLSQNVMLNGDSWESIFKLPTYTTTKTIATNYTEPIRETSYDNINKLTTNVITYYGYENNILYKYITTIVIPDINLSNSFNTVDRNQVLNYKDIEE